jgi:hypothetical protein
MSDVFTALYLVIPAVVCPRMFFSGAGMTEQGKGH